MLKQARPSMPTVMEYTWVWRIGQQTNKHITPLPNDNGQQWKQGMTMRKGDLFLQKTFWEGHFGAVIYCWRSAEEGNHEEKLNKIPGWVNSKCKDPQLEWGWTRRAGKSMLSQKARWGWKNVKWSQGWGQSRPMENNRDIGVAWIWYILHQFMNWNPGCQLMGFGDMIRFQGICPNEWFHPLKGS